MKDISCDMYIFVPLKTSIGHSVQYLLFACVEMEFFQSLSDRLVLFLLMALQATFALNLIPQLLFLPNNLLGK